MDKTNSKIMTVSFAVASALLGLTINLLIKAFSGAFGVVARFADNDLVRHVLPVAVGVVVFAALQFNPKVVAWGNDVILEIRKIVWPNRKDTTAMTIVVVIMVLISSVIISTFDLVSGFLINNFIR